MNEGVDMFANANATKANATRIQPAAALNCLDSTNSYISCWNIKVYYGYKDDSNF